MKRGGPLRRTTSLRNRSSLSRSGLPTRRPKKSDAVWRKVHAEVKARVWCEAGTPACVDGRHHGVHAHHVILRSRGGPDEAWNLRWVCAPAHDWIHGNPAAATERGLMGSA